MRASRYPEPRPFLKWAGGKAQLLPALLQKVGGLPEFNGYHEPFLGGGALFFALSRKGVLEARRVYLSDSNASLIEAYEVVRDELERLIERLEVHRDRHDEAHYYRVRAEVPGDPVARAARMIYLNKTCFNGLYRVNSKGLFNVPMGRYVRPSILDRSNLEAVSRALRGVELLAASFETTLDRAREGDFVYFDPPYHPLSETSSFTSYDRNGFGPADQERLADVVAGLSRRGVHVLLSNSATGFIESLYARFKLESVTAARTINSRGSSRGAVREVLVRNF